MTGFKIYINHLRKNCVNLKEIVKISLIKRNPYQVKYNYRLD